MNENKLDLSKTSKLINKESSDLPKYLKTTSNPTYNNLTLENKGKFQKKFRSDFNYGISYESPTYFRSKHTLINKDSYKNPFLTNPEAYYGDNKLPNIISNNKIRNTQSFKIGEKIDMNIFDKTKLPSVNIYDCILDKKTKINERDMIIQENSSFIAEYNQMTKLNENSFHLKQGLFGDFVEKNNIMNVFGHLLKKDRGQTFGEKSIKNYIKTDNPLISSKNSNNNTIGILKDIDSKSKIIIIQNDSKISKNIKNSHNRKKFKLSELKTIPFSIKKFLIKSKLDATTYPLDTEKYTKNDPKYFNLIRNTILKKNIIETIETNKNLLIKPYCTPLIHNLYKEEFPDLENFEKRSKFYKFLEPLSKKDLQKRYKVK